VRFLVFLVTGLMHCCSPIPMLNKQAALGGITFAQDIPYAAGPRNTLDVYAPPSGSTPVAVVVFLYGGGWETGEKSMYRFVGAALAAQRFLVMIPDYRLHPDVQFPAFMEDGARAVAWAHANAGRFGGDPDRMFLMGHSAGAQIATLLALDPDYLRQTAVHICGVIGLAGPYDFLPLSREREAVFGASLNWPKSQPINYVTASAPPMLLLTGGSDGVVDPGNVTRLAARLRSAGADVRTDIYPGISHTGIIAAFGDGLTFMAPAREATVAFLTAHRACRQ
jgi:acetyl esterase/lipase